MPHQAHRRRFLATTLACGAAGIGVALARRCRAAGANERLNIGVIGVGGRGAANLQGVAGENVAALCDVDENRLDAAASQHPKAAKYFDYRKLLDQKDLDAVVISTPDHHHAPAAVRALNRGLHVYCEKPLTHTVAEARQLRTLAAEKKVATQMGTQNHEHPGYRRVVELIESGAIGDVREVHVMTDRPGRHWQQGLGKPKDQPAVPSGLKWDLWLGPAAERAYHPAYIPFKWRGWWDFGTGAIGDMAIHLMDPAFWALKLGGPVSVTSEGPDPLPHSGPTWMKTRFRFGQREKLPPVDVFWYEGQTKPPEEIAADLPMNGSLFIGDKGRLKVVHNEFPVLLPEEKFADFKGPEPYLPESPGHHRQWIEACKTGSRTGSSFDYAGPFTETVLLGNIAYRSGKSIDFDPDQMKVTNVAEANEYLTKTYRQGWEV